MTESRWAGQIFMPPLVLQYVFIGTVVYGMEYFVFITLFLSTGLTGVEEYPRRTSSRAIAGWKSDKLE